MAMKKKGLIHLQCHQINQMAMKKKGLIHLQCHQINQMAMNAFRQ